MNIVKFNQTGGFPLTTNILNEMQKAYSIFNSLGTIAGNFSIISGCEVVGSNVSEGVVFINGELYPFKGGRLNAKVKIIERFESKDFEDGSNKKVVFKYHVEFGGAVANSFEWSEFKRFDTNISLTQKSTDLLDRIDKLEKLVKKTVPIGLVAIWDRPANEIPEGWVEHKKLRGRVPVGHDPNYNYSNNTDRTNYKLNKKGHDGGKSEHKLSVEEMPEHKHSSNNVFNKFNAVSSDLGNGQSIEGANWGDQHLDYTTGIVNSNYDWSDVEEKLKGNDKAHTNMQPYRVVRYIIFIGFN